MKKPSKKGSQSGLHGLMSRLSSKGLRGLDRRSSGYRAVKEWRCELERDLGGVSALSAQQRMLIENAVRIRLYLDHADGFLLSRSTVIDRKAKSLIPLMQQRQQLAASLVGVLEKLGLSRVEPPVTLEGVEIVQPHAIEEDEPDEKEPTA